MVEHDHAGSCPSEIQPDARDALCPACAELEQMADVRAERDRWIRLFNRLEAAITHHKKAKSAMFVDEVDEALYAARDRVLRDAATNQEGRRED